MNKKEVNQLLKAVMFCRLVVFTVHRGDFTDRIKNKGAENISFLCLTKTNTVYGCVLVVGRKKGLKIHNQVSGLFPFSKIQ